MKAVMPNPSTLQITGGTALRRWRENQKVWVSSAPHVPAFKKGYWDGYRRPGSMKSLGRKGGEKISRLTVERGFLERVKEAFPDLEIQRDYYPPPDLSDLELAAKKFPIEKFSGKYDYQRDALEMIFTRYWGRLALATNAGKGAVIAVAAGIAAEANINALILADEIAVFDALSEEIEKWAGIEPAKVESGRDDPPKGEPVVLAMVPTLTRRLGKEKKKSKRHDRAGEWCQWLSQVGMVLLDEADRATADSWTAILDRMPNTYFRIGFSGSFDTHDELDMMKQELLMGPILERVKNIELVERGISAKPHVELWRYEQDITDLPPHGEWWDMSGPERRRYAYEAGVMRNDHRHQLIFDMLHGDEQNAIVVNRVEHGEILAEIIPDSVFLFGGDSKEVRREELQRFRNEEFQNLITTKILDRGTNLLGKAVGLIFASGEGSQTQTLQRVGRGLRRGDGKEYLFLKDIIDVPPPWEGEDKRKPYKYFKNAARKRIALYNDEGFEVSIVDPGG